MIADGFLHVFCCVCESAAGSGHADAAVLDQVHVAEIFAFLRGGIAAVAPCCSITS